MCAVLGCRNKLQNVHKQITDADMQDFFGSYSWPLRTAKKIKFPVDSANEKEITYSPYPQILLDSKQNILNQVQSEDNRWYDNKCTLKTDCVILYVLVMC